MNITRCDICKQQKKEKASSLDEESKWTHLDIRGKGDWLCYDLCDKCSKNLLRYIKRYLGIKKSKKK